MIHSCCCCLENEATQKALFTVHASHSPLVSFASTSFSHPDVIWQSCIAWIEDSYDRTATRQQEEESKNELQERTQQWMAWWGPDVSSWDRLMRLSVNRGSGGIRWENNLQPEGERENTAWSFGKEKRVLCITPWRVTRGHEEKTEDRKQKLLSLSFFLLLSPVFFFLSFHNIKRIAWINLFTSSLFCSRFSTSRWTRCLCDKMWLNSPHLFFPGSSEDNLSLLLSSSSHWSERYNVSGSESG